MFKLKIIVENNEDNLTCELWVSIKTDKKILGVFERNISRGIFGPKKNVKNG